MPVLDLAREPVRFGETEALAEARDERGLARDCPVCPSPAGKRCDLSDVPSVGMHFARREEN